MVLMLLAMAGVWLYGSVPLIMNPGPVEVICPTKPRKLACELGAGIVGLLPAKAQRTVLGVSGLATTMGVLWLVGVITLREKR
ncbi:MAG: hypothetical protein IV104_19615 [Acidovorax sp.]|nr:hypothetical protein [Acidovorax sp.]